jgi:dihydrofolate reductase
MRKIVAFNRVSADGYFTTGDGDLSWTVPEPDIDKGAVSNMAGQGTILFGRRTYEMFERFWPNVKEEDGTAPDPHAAGRRTPELLAMARHINAARKIVFSKTRQDVTWTNSELLRDVDARTVQSLKDEPGGDIMIFGSGTVVSKLTELGLVDEYHFIVGPVLLGDGRPLVAGLPEHVSLRLLDAKPHPQGNVMLRYERARTAT